MKQADGIRVLGWLVRDTFRQSLASSAFWIILGLSLLAILFCLSVHIAEPGPLFTPNDIEVNPYRARLVIGFGALSIPMPRNDARAAVLFLEFVLGGWAAGAVGLLMALLWTAGFLPAFLDPSAATVLLAKPVPRSWLLLGKTLGVLAFTTLQMAIFFFGTWAALGLRTGVWAPEYLLCLPLVVVQFFAIFGVSVLLAVLTRSTVVCLVGCIAFFAFCYSVNFAYHVETLNTVSQPSLPGFLSSVGYWVLPKPADAVVLLYRLLDAGRNFTLTEALDQARFSPWLSVLTSLGFGVVVLLVAAWRLERSEY